MLEFPRGDTMINIMETQNKDEVLMLIFSARKYYSNAEKLKVALWIISVLPIIIGKLNFDNTNFKTFNVLVTSSIIPILVFFLNFLLKKWIDIAANTKEVVDKLLFDFSIDKICMDRYLDKAIENKQKYEKEYEIQSKNTGRDNPPGIKDWYEINSSDDELELILNCQKQNVYFDRKILKKFSAILCCFFIVVLACIIFISFGSTLKEFLMKLIPFTSLGLMLFIEYEEYKKVEKEIISIDTNFEIIEKISGKQNKEFILKKVQNSIFNRRKAHFLTPSILHKIYSKTLHKLWKTLHKKHL